MSVAAPPVLVIAGPTGSGKSRLAVDIAHAFDGVIINADSMQLYRELRILTARPTDAELATAPHRLYGVHPIAEPCSVASWLALACVEINSSWSDGRLPIVVGGTGLYLKALRNGMAPVPAIPPAVRAASTSRYDRLGGEAFRAELAVLDPDAAARLPSGDRQRLIRADEVVRATGRTLGNWQREAVQPPLIARFATVALLPPRAQLYATIEARFDRMLAAGAMEEVAALADRDPGLPGMKALGVRPLLLHLHNQLSVTEASRLAKRDSRRYAKRQLTWLRHQMPGPDVAIEQLSESSKPELFAFIRDFLLTPVR